MNRRDAVGGYSYRLSKHISREGHQHAHIKEHGFKLVDIALHVDADDLFRAVVRQVGFDRVGLDLGRVDRGQDCFDLLFEALDALAASA